MPFLHKTDNTSHLPSAAASTDAAGPPYAPVVIITGASSGIGHATALAFARTGARLVLAARSEGTLSPVGKACRREGAATVLVVPTDVTDAKAVERLADAALSEHGRIDVWVNGVGVGAVGRFDEAPVNVHRRVVESNLIGHLNGAHAALRHFRERGRGLLINMISLGGWVPTPFAAAYTASKFGLRGLSESLRAEVSDLPDVHICDVAPTFVDSPGLSHGANYTGRNLAPPLPMVDPRRVADAVVALTQEPRPRAVTWIGAAAAPGRLAHALAPGALGAFLRWATDKALRRARPVERSDGNLFAPSRGTDIDGGQRKAHRTTIGTAAALGVVGLALGIWAARQQGTGVDNTDNHRP